MATTFYTTEMVTASQGIGAPDVAERYSRQVLFRGIGREGQEKLARAHVALVGVGATGVMLLSLPQATNTALAPSETVNAIRVECLRTKESVPMASKMSQSTKTVNGVFARSV